MATYSISNLPTAGYDVHMQRMSLWLIEKGLTASDLSLASLQHNWLPFLNICLCQRGCFKKVEKSTVSLSYIIHQVAITAADRKVYPRRPCVLPASAKVRVTVPPDWTLSAQPLNILVCTACCRPWGLTERREWRTDVKRGVWDSPGWLWMWHSLPNMTVILLDIKKQNHIYNKLN